MTQEIQQHQATESHAPSLTPIEARVLGCLMEKQRTTPDTYPLTLNALVQACNQKTSRNPVMHLDTAEVGHTVNLLRDRGLIHASFAGRVERYDHKMASNYQLDRQQQAVLCMLMLRGPQTPGELRSNACRLAEIPDLDAVEKILSGLESRDQPLVVRLPRLPGKREERFGQLLCGEITQEPPAADAPTEDTKARDERILALETEINRLRRELDTLWELTGLSGRKPAA